MAPFADTDYNCGLCLTAIPTLLTIKFLIILKVMCMCMCYSHMVQSALFVSFAEQNSCVHNGGQPLTNTD